MSRIKTTNRQYYGCHLGLLRKSNEPMPVHGIFLTKPKIKYTVKRSRFLPDGYPLRPRTIGEKIKKKRLDMGLFQKDVAKIIGVDVNTITLWEKGRCKPSKAFLGKLEEFLVPV
jgi:DNA-binding XRE family transcriptional regulator